MMRAMTHISGTLDTACAGDAGEEIARLREVLALVEQIAGRQPSRDAGLDENARIGAAYESALPIVQRRFDSLAAETARWATAGVEALLTLHERGRPCRAAASKLADELDQALLRLRRMLSI
jgi:hypothetical protein